MRSIKTALILMMMCLLCTTTLQAQTLYNKKNGGYQFTVVKDVEATQVQNQYRSSTCWSFSALSFFESELIRMGKKGFNFSEMFVVRHSYSDKAKRYVRMHGALNFGPGGAFHDALNVLRTHGMVPEEVYSGKNIGEKNHIHNEMDHMLKAIVTSVTNNKNGKLTPIWHDAFNAALDTYLGTVPENFEYNGKTYTPKTYASELGLNPDDYVEITSFNHHPFYDTFILEVPDNWAWGEVYNLPLEEFGEVLDHALMNNYSVAWASDISEKGFSWKNGVAIVPEEDWSDMSKAKKDSVLNHPVPQKEITQELRQTAFDNYQTQDDHGMHITGIVKAQDGTPYYIVKNSWGVKSNDCDGYLYASKAFVLYKSTGIMVHKDAIPKDIRKKLGI